MTTPIGLADIGIGDPVRAKIGPRVAKPEHCTSRASAANCIFGRAPRLLSNLLPDKLHKAKGAYLAGLGLRWEFVHGSLSSVSS